ncbi:uncharacterized protein LOC110459534 isoform X1 [Mizuhopecten yessoensis]|uniref:uncharacterized protein LOC110459534 isoform X1 n=1 Tax=Mizuhopecten yessoensis TaxID=6573 RepID=UPI000B45F4F1|nr:uncharacterized protein LOC110459534 isoform X1 [Mizuhopecten yessoensis]XP_021367523.1 uncharacterized protein LOC110459534 isoform X1 [Mizuhopecten yessoensis]
MDLNPDMAPSHLLLPVSHVAKENKTMVRLKKGELKHRQTKGNTICRRCLNKNEKAQSFICKFVLDRRVGMEDKDDVVDFLKDHLDDGGMVHEYDNLQTNFLLYSLNKHKRWMIASHIVNLVERTEIQEEDFRLVLHERLTPTPKRCHNCVLDPVASVLDPVASVLDPVELKESSISYHDSKFNLVHSYPNGVASTLTDLSLRCYHDNIDHDTISSEQKSRKLHYKDVMRGDAHPVVVPEIRYEITYPDTVVGPCKCYTDTDYKYRWETKVKRFGWKAKGNRNRPWSRWFYKGLDHMEHQMYCDGYRDDSSHIQNHLSYEDDDTINVHPPRRKYRQLTIKDFGSYNGNCNASKKAKNERRKKKRLHSQDDVEKSMQTVRLKRSNDNGKGDISNVGTRIAEIKWRESIKDVKNDATLGVLGDDFDKSFCTCLLDKDSIETMRSHPSGFKLLFGNCVPQQLSLTMTGQTTQAQLLLWQKTEWSKWSFVAEYRLKILLKPNTTGQKMIPILLREELAGDSDRVYTVYELLNAARHVVDLLTEQQGHPGKGVTKSQRVRPTGRVKGVSVNLKPVQKEKTAPLPQDTKVSVDKKKKKIWEMDLTSDGGLLEAYDLLPTSLTQTMDFGFCKSCLRHFDPPLLKGCVLLPCLHYYCVTCWRKYIWEEIQKGCTTISCKQKLCTEVVDEVMIQNLMSCDLFNQWLCSRAEKNCC